MTTIRNKQTGEKLTGEVKASGHVHLDFKVNGCRVTTSLDATEWDILPPPLPSGIGAVVSTKEGYFIQVQRGVWRTNKGNSSNFDDDEVSNFAPVTTLSEGVNLSGSPE